MGDIKGYPANAFGVANFIRNSSGEWVAWDGSQTIDFTADIEIDGTTINQRGYQFSSSGDNTIITPTSGKRLKIYRVVIYPDADLTGDVQIKLNTTVLSRIRNPKTGGAYGFNCSPNFNIGATDDTLIINLPSANTCNADVTWEEVT